MADGLEVVEFSNARQNLKTYMDKVCLDDKPIVIVSLDSEKDTVMISLQQYTSLMESIDQLKLDNYSEMELVG